MQLCIKVFLCRVQNKKIKKINKRIRHYELFGNTFMYVFTFYWSNTILFFYLIFFCIIFYEIFDFLNMINFKND